MFTKQEAPITHQDGPAPNTKGALHVSTNSSEEAAAGGNLGVATNL